MVERQTSSMLEKSLRIIRAKVLSFPAGTVSGFDSRLRKASFEMNVLIRETLSEKEHEEIFKIIKKYTSVFKH